MFRTFCEEMREDPALVLTMLEEMGHLTPASQRANARIRNDIEMSGSFNLSDALWRYGDLDQLTDAEIEYLRGLER